MANVEFKLSISLKEGIGRDQSKRLEKALDDKRVMRNFIKKLSQNHRAVGITPGCGAEGEISRARPD